MKSRSARALLAVACALCALLVTGNASALAPMCNELAQTIEAPPPVFHSDGGTIRASDCAPDHFAKAPPGSPHRAEAFAFSATLKLAPATQVVVPGQVRPPRRPIADAETIPPPGHDGGIYRPPRA